MTIGDTVSIWEVAWTLPALAGLLFTAWMTVDLWRDRRAFRASGRNGLGLLQVSRWFYSEAIVVVVHGIFTLVGLFALTAPPSSPEPERSPAALGITALFVGVPVLLVVRSIGDRLTRQAIKRAWGGHEAERPWPIRFREWLAARWRRRG